MYCPQSSDPINISPPLSRRGLNFALIPYKLKTSPAISPVKYNSLLEIILEEKELVESLPAVEFCVEKEDDAVQSSDYYFDGLSPLIGKDKNTFRPRKFKELTKEAKEDPAVKALKGKRKELQQELVDCTQRRMPESLTDLIVCSAEKGDPFLMIEHHLPPLHTTLPMLKGAYLTAVNKSKPFTLPDQLSQLVDFDTMDHSEALARAGYKEAKHAGKIDKAAWENRKTLIARFEKHWNGDPLQFEHSKSSAVQCTIKTYCTSFLSQIYLLKTGGIFAAMKKQYHDCDLKILNPVIAIIISEIQSRSKQHQENAETALVTLREECLKNPLKSFIEEASLELLVRDSKLRASSSLSCTGGNPKIFLLSNLIKEQRQHSLARFYNLLNYYTAFVNTIHLMGKTAEEIKTGGQNVVAEVVSKILENSFLEFDDNPRARSVSASPSAAPALTLSEAEIEKLITIHTQAHREKDIMGWEKKPIREQDKELASQTLNLFLAAFKDEKPIRKFERAHTLPFPSCFAWKEDKERTFIGEAGETFSKAPKSKPVLFNNVVFKKIAGEKVDHKEIEEHFKKVFERHKEDYAETSEFIYMSLETVRRFYLRLFSETELLPDFINIDLDSISEWREPGSEQTYKRSLALALRSLVGTKSACTHADVVDALVPYFTATQKKVALLHKNWTAEKDKSSKALIKLIGLYQVEEALRTALLNRSKPAAISAIFTEAIPVL